MKNTLCILLLLTFCTSLFGQKRYLEIEKGIKKITTYKYSGKNEKKKKKLEHTKTYAVDGKLTKVDYSWAVYEYYHEGDIVIEVKKRNNENNCTAAYEYHLSRDSSKLTVKQKAHTGKYATQEPCEIYGVEGIFGRVKVDSLFPNIEKTMKGTGFDYVWIYDYKNPKMRKEYTSYLYGKSRYGNTLKLKEIITNESDKGEGYLYRWHQVSRYGVHLEQQKLIDQFDNELKILGDDELIEPTGKIFGQYEYEFDEKNNWVQRYVIVGTERHIMNERIIEYYK